MKTLCILLLMACCFLGMAQEAKKDNMTNSQQYYQDPEYAPMGKLYATYFDAYLYVLGPERRKDFLNWYNKGNESAVNNREKHFQEVLRKNEQLTSAQRDSIMKIPPIHERKAPIEVQLMTMDETVFDAISIRDREKEVLELFKGHPVYVVTIDNSHKTQGPKSVRKAIYFQKTMNWLCSWVVVRIEEDLQRSKDSSKR